MRSLNPYLFIHTGLLIRLLRHSQGFIISLIVSEADRLMENLDAAGFQVSLAGTRELKNFITALRGDQNQQRMITKEETNSLTATMSVIEKMVHAEAQTKLIYVVTEGRFSLDYLMNHPDKMFAPDVFQRLPPLAQYDISEGFMCVVLARPTAAAFHVLRATEATLKKYYFTRIRRGRDKNPMWASMLSKLVARRDKDQGLLQKLDFIRGTYRNPTSHPEAKYTLDTAQDLLGLCLDAINSMGASLSKETASIQF